MSTPLCSVALPTVNPDGSVTWGGLSPAFPQPTNSTLTSPPAVGTDGTGAPVVAGFGQLTLTWATLSLTAYQALRGLWLQTRTYTSSRWGLVRLQWPDPLSGTTTLATAQWDSFQTVDRGINAVTGLTATFSHLGILDLAATGGWYLPPYR